jgi:hypothetical protein
VTSDHGPDAGPPHHDGGPPAGPRPGDGPPRRALGLRARHVRRVTAADVGHRVSLRRWITDPRRGPVQSDVVGRLVAWTDDVLVVVDREGSGTRVRADDVVSSRVVPEHPRMAAEPEDAGSRARPLAETVVRVLLLDPDTRVLLRRPTPGWDRWHAPGTLLRRRQKPAEAARAVVVELVDDAEVRVDPPVAERTALREEAGMWWRTEERWLPAHWPFRDAEDDADAAWWSLARLAEEAPPVDPGALAARLESWSRDGLPDEPVTLPPPG